jgi:NAD(P)-dependent dehydrogenase (short-subunit alcohol dehydrogenase family)
MRNPERGQTLQRATQREKLLVSILALDVDSDESVTKTVAAIQSEAGFIDVLVNNAGIERQGSLLEECALVAVVLRCLFGGAPLGIIKHSIEQQNASH